MVSRHVPASIALLVLAACAGSGAGDGSAAARADSVAGKGGASRRTAPPPGPPSIEGTITDMRIAGEHLAVIRVEENPSDSAGSAKASVTVSNTTRVIGNAGGGDMSRLREELRAGRRVRVWFVGPVAESYPVQARAAALELIP